MEQRPPARGHANDVAAALGERRFTVHTGRPLVSAEGQRGPRPAVYAKHRDAATTRAGHERLVERHVFRSIERRGEKQTPGQPFGGYNEGSRGTSRLDER